VKPKNILLAALIILWGLILTWGVVYANNIIYQTLSENPHNTYLNDILSDIVLLFVAFMPIVWLPRFFGYQIGSVVKHWKLLLGLAIFFVAAPLLYRLIAGETPFGANTWFFEGVVVPIAEEGLFRGILFSMLLWGFAKLFSPRISELLAIIIGSLIFASGHLNNLGHYPAGFILFQVGFSIIVGLVFSYSRAKTASIYPPMILHALFNLAGTL
jgi:membrane protease YdiL (CAAX protease family)